MLLNAAIRTSDSSIFQVVLTRVLLVLGIVGTGLFGLSPPTSPALTATSRPTSLFEKIVPSLPAGFNARPKDPWGHRMGTQTAEEFAAYYGPAWIPTGLLEAGGVLDAYSEFASAKTHRKSDYITISFVRLASDADATQLISMFEEALTRGLTPAPGGGTVKEIEVPGIPGSEAYQSWFEGSASFDIVFVRGSTVAELDRTTPSKAVATKFGHFAAATYRKMKLGPTSVT
jgi:hypothetical protein